MLSAPDHLCGHLRMPVYILAGGHSSRFGTDKARAEIVGVPLIVRIASSLSRFATDIQVVADMPGKYADLGLKTIADTQTHQGPLGGLIRALEHRLSTAGAGWLLLSGCDWAEVSAECCAALLAQLAVSDLAAAFFDGRWEPLLALYHTRILERARLEMAGRRSLQFLLTQAGATRVRIPHRATLTQLNTQSEMGRFLQSRHSEPESEPDRRGVCPVRSA